MKKYNKPTLNIEELSVVNTIANSTSILNGTHSFETNTNDKSFDFESFWK